MTPSITGSEALAHGAIAAGVSFVTSYAGSPATYVVNSLLDLTSPEDVRIEWTANEKVAIEMAFGASLAGVRSLLAVKSVGLNIALDPLMTLNLSGCHAGFVILLGDDPGSWGSQNEQDSRALALAAELPVLEPTTVPDAYQAMYHAFNLSEETGLPVIVRITRALSLARAEVHLTATRIDRTLPFKREFNRWVVLPINVVPFHLRLHKRLEDLRARFETSPFNQVEGDGPHGLLAAGFAYHKLLDLLGGELPPRLRLLRLGTFHPFPTQFIADFLRQVDSVLVLEETAPLVEDALHAIAHTAGLHTGNDDRHALARLPIYGRRTAHLPTAGELFAPHLAAAVNRFLPALDLPLAGPTSRPRPSLQPLGDECFFTPTFAALRQALEQRGGRDRFIIVGDPGCMVQAQTPPDYLMDVKHSLGASIGMAAGIALHQSGPDAKRVVSIIGDSSFLHTGFNALVDAVQVGAQMLVLILDNGSTALSGGQPHPATGLDARGRPRGRVDLAALARAAGAASVHEVDVDAGQDLHAPLAHALDTSGLTILIARGKCDCY